MIRFNYKRTLVPATRATGSTEEGNAAKTRRCALRRSGGLAGAVVLLLASIPAGADGPGATAGHIVRVAGRAERDRMEAHLRSLYDRRDVRHSFKQPSGDEIDCVDVDKQPALRRPEMRGNVVLTPPAFAPKPRSHSDGTEADTDDAHLMATEPFTGEPDENGAARKCPETAIPIRRISINDMMRFKNLEDRFRKYPGYLAEDADASTRTVRDESGSQPSALRVPPAYGPTDYHQYAPYVPI